MSEDYINGMEEGVEMVKKLYEMTSDERKEKFGTTLVSDILDKNDFAQIAEKLKEKRLVLRWMIRGYDKIGNKFESPWYDVSPSKDMVSAFIDYNTLEYAQIVSIYVKE